jgi:predicted transcriptional regulator/transcriptional regulator with XRE-family HTH domain
MAVQGPVGIRIRDYRKRAGITQVELARRSGISASYLNLIEADKRAVGGSLLKRIADELQVDLDILSGTEERRIIERLADVAAAPVLQPIGIDPTTANALVSRHPDWSRGLLEVWRTYQDGERHIEALNDRLTQDPAVAEAIYDVLNAATAIRSTTEVLDTVADLPEDQRHRFVEIIMDRSAGLSRQAEHLVTLFGHTTTGSGSLSPAEEADDFFIHHQAWFPSLEVVAEQLRASLFDGDPPGESALARILDERHNIQISRAADSATTGTHGVRHDPVEGRVEVSDNAPTASIRFHLMAFLVGLEAPECADPLLDPEVLTTDAARSRARRALYSWAAAAVLLPYKAFLADAIDNRYDIEALARIYGASVEQVSLRLLALKRQGEEGIPFGLMKTDPSGHVSKRFPIPGLPLPRSGTGCPIWPLYSSFQTPDRMVRQLAEFPNGSRYLLIARTLRRNSFAFHATPFLNSVMLICDAVYADRTVYGDGLDLSGNGIAAAVGPACRLCPRVDCGHRGEESTLTRQN